MSKARASRSNDKQGFARHKVKPASGQPLGVNPVFKIAANLVLPILSLITKREWIGAERLPASGPLIVASNHVTYLDPLVLGHFLFRNGRAPRYLGKSSLFSVPLLGRLLYAAGQVPVYRGSDQAKDALLEADELLANGHCIAIYPEGTLTRDENLWPMVAKTGAVRLALRNRQSILPIAQWGAHQILPRYEKSLHLWPRKSVKILVGEMVDLSPYFNFADDPVVQREATDLVMLELTKLVAKLRGEAAPAQVFDLRTSELPKTGNFLKWQADQSKRKPRRQK
jgi:1-acyl-sn-glycerol-3-phosphate acyltransferase